LEKERLSLAVVNARFAKPLDEETILSYAQQGNAVITVEEGVVSGGFGSAVRELLDRERRFGLRFLAIGLPPEVYPLGKADEIRKIYGLDAAGLAGRIRRFLSE
jgi:1-deoxy-D-xylulose-5-phosphate synthase